MDLNNWQTQLRKGVLELVVLNLLSRDEYHGYDMVRILKHTAGLAIREGNIYPILARLQTDGAITSHTIPSADGPPKKCFKLTPAGTRLLEEMNRQWKMLAQSIETITKGQAK